MNILYLADELNYADGVSTHLFYLLRGIIKNKNIRISLMCSGGDAIEKFKEAGIEVNVNENFNHRTRSVKGFLSALKSVSGHCIDRDVNMIHSHNHYNANIASASLKIRLNKKVKTVQTVHGIIPDTGKLNHLNAQSYVAVNDHVYQHLAKKILKEDKISLIYNGIDFRDSKIKSYNDRLKFISAGRLEEGKNTGLFIKAVSMLTETERSKAEFIIAGEGNKSDELKEADKNLSTGIKFTGLIKDLRTYFENCDVFVMTSGSEGLPMSILEAAAEKVLVVTSAFNGVKNILNENSDGFLYPVGNAEKLSVILKTIIDKPEMNCTFTDNFYRTAREKFNSEIMTIKHTELYTKLLSQP